MQTACGIISDLSNSIGEALNEYLADFVPCLQQLLNAAELDKRTKLAALHALGALSLNSASAFNDFYLAGFLNTLSEAAQASCNQAQIDKADLESRTYLNELRIEIIENFATVLYAIADETSNAKKQQQMNLYMNHAFTILGLIESAMTIDGCHDSCNAEKHRYLIENAVGLLMIMARTFCHNENLKGKLTQPCVQTLLTCCNNLADEESRELAADTYESIKSMCTEQGKNLGMTY